VDTFATLPLPLPQVHVSRSRFPALVPQEKKFYFGHIFLSSTLSPYLIKTLNRAWWGQYPAILTSPLVNDVYWYMAGSASGQDEANSAFWLATRAARWGRLARSRFPALVPQKSFLFGNITNLLLTKLVWLRWLYNGLVLFRAFIVIKNAKKNLTNVQPSWPNNLGQ